MRTNLCLLKVAGQKSCTVNFTQTFIRLFIFNNFLIAVRAVVNLRGKDTPRIGHQFITAHHSHTFIDIWGQFSVSNPLSGMFLGGERKPENLEETHRDMKRACTETENRQ